MARRTVQTLLDDIDRCSPAVETISFGLDGELFTIDLNDEHALQLRESLALFVRQSRRTGGRRTPLTRTVSARAWQAKARDNRVRAWARARGLPVSERGSISTDVWIQYQQFQQAQDFGSSPVQRGRAASSTS